MAETSCIIRSDIEKSGAILSFIEVPLLFEGGFQDLFDGVIVIKRDVEERIAAIIKRSGLTRREVLLRIKNQFDYEKTDENAYTIICNDDLSSLEKKVMDAVEKFTENDA
ncbi:MAG: dephospho-CoA kinase [Elusimicrobiales bacterium]|nr:dephospho-CoA kinase [Elusimicrobiales bacterium]